MIYAQYSPNGDDDDSFVYDEDAEDNFYSFTPGKHTPTTVTNSNNTTTHNSNNKVLGQYNLCGSMWKRRFGLGRNADRNW